MSIIYRGQFDLIIIVWLSSIFTIMISIAVGSLKESVFEFVMYVPTSILMMLELKRQNMTFFARSEKLQYLLTENERLANESYATELRHMIGNVAHDLKTVFYFFILSYCNTVIKIFISFH
jgi:hypothetical protein